MSSLVYVMGATLLSCYAFFVWILKPRSSRHKPCGGKIISQMVRRLDPDGDGCPICCTIEVRKCSKCHAIVSQDGYSWDPDDPPTLADKEFADYHLGAIEDLKQTWFAPKVAAQSRR